MDGFPAKMVRPAGAPGWNIDNSGQREELMGKGRDRGPRRRGFDDDMFSPRDFRDERPQRSFGGPPPRQMMQPQADGPTVDATVKWFNPEKGFGFAELGDGSGD